MTRCLAIALGLTFLAACQAELKEYVDSQITTDTTWAKADTHHLNGQVFVKAGATLTIEAGVDVVCYYTPADSNKVPSAVNEAHTATATHAAVLVIEKGAKIMAQGTAANPITFKSQEVPIDPAKAESGTWGGIIVLGDAPTNGCDDKTVKEDGKSHIEGLDNEMADSSYGGSNAADNSGVMTYVRIWFGGAQLSKDNEINGLTLGGVGSGTTINHIEIAYNLDDGLELFGGTVDIQYLSLLYNRDDQLDIDCGYQGNIQFAFITEKKQFGDHAYEIDGHNGCSGSGCSITPRTVPKISQVTILGPGQDASCGYKDDQLIKINDGAAGIYVNHILTYSPKAGSVTDNDLTPTTGDSVPSGSDPLFFKYYSYMIPDHASLIGGTDILEWDDHCMPAPCTPSADLTITDAKFGPGLAQLGDLTSISIAGMSAANYPGAFAPGADTWLKGWSLLDAYGKLETTSNCKAPEINRGAVDGAQGQTAVASPILGALAATAACAA